MKGVSASIVVVALVVVLVAVFVFYNSGSLPFSPTKTYDNTVIHLTQKLISDSTPLQNEKVNIMFYVTNQGDKTVNDVKVNFFDIVGFSNNVLLCQTGDSTQMVQSTDGRTCDIMNILPGDARQVSLTITASSPTSQGIVQYSVGYDYSGTRTIEIPIIDQGASLPSGIHYIINPSTVGPIQVSIQPPVGSQQVVNGNAVTENFARLNVPFTLQFSVSDVGNPEGTKMQTVLQPSTLTVSATKFSIDQCVSDYQFSKTQTSASGSTVTNTHALAIPDDTSVTCVMEDDSSAINVFDMGTVQISFNYHYSFENTDSFTIRTVSQ